MKITINGSEIESNIESNTTLATTLQTIEADHVAENEVITAICLDGDPLTTEQLSIWRDRPIDEFDEANVEIQSRKDLAAKALKMIADSLQENGQLRMEICEYLHQAKTREASEMIPRYLKVWNAVQLNLGAAARLMYLELETLEVFDLTDPQSPHTILISDALRQLAQHLNQIKSSLENQDMVLLGDILDYEFSDLESSWVKILRKLAAQFNPDN